MSRFDNRNIVNNIDDLYIELLEKRGIEKLKHYTTPKMKYPTKKQIGTLNNIPHIWTMGDRYEKLAHQYYGDSRLWWIIGWYNKKPTEFHVKLGETIYIPLPLDRILSYLGF